jgi:FkbM family methyltransferase
MNIANNLVQLFQLTDSLGYSKGFSAFAKTKLHRTCSIQLNGIRHPFRLRGGSSDTSAFRQVFVFNEYDFPVSVEPKFIIDGGSNVGLAAIYFANKFPKATIVSIEPESSNFTLLKENTERYPNIHPIQSGLWSISTLLRVKDIGLGNWGYIVEETDQEDKDTFRAISISDIMKQFGVSEIDILKLDVEGSEKEIFTRNYREWLPKTRVLVVELHDRLKEGCSRALFSALLEYKFSVEQKGENLVCTRN